MTAATASRVLDERDSAILAARLERFERVGGPRVGDYIRFACGTERRISFVTPAEWLPDVDSIQTSEPGGANWYLGEDGCSFSGSLYPGVRRDTLTDTGERRGGLVWFFHHDYWERDNGVYTDPAERGAAELPFRVFECSEEATR